MPRYDKYDPIAGGFRAALAADWAAADGVIIGVGLDVNGRVVPGAGNTGIIGVVVLVGVQKKAGNIVDVMTHGEIVEAGLVAGSKYYALNTTGALQTSATSATALGYTVEAGRLIMRKGA